MLRFYRSFFAGLTLLGLLVSPLLHADDQAVEILATAWGETLAQDGSGFYNEIAADVLGNIANKKIYKIMPYRRAKQHFFNAGGACLYPSSLPSLATAGEIKDPENYIESDGIFVAKTHLFVRSDVQPPQSLEDISGKTIAYPSGSVAAGILFGHGASLIGVNSEQDKAQMLVSGRVDMITGMMPDTAIVFAKMGGEVPLFAPSFVLYEVPVTFVCQRSAATEKFIISVNKALEVLSHDPIYSARLIAAATIEDAFARASGYNAENRDVPKGERPVPSKALKTPRKNRSGRRLPKHNN